MSTYENLPPDEDFAAVAAGVLGLSALPEDPWSAFALREAHSLKCKICTMSISTAPVTFERQPFEARLADLVKDHVYRVCTTTAKNGIVSRDNFEHWMILGYGRVTAAKGSEK